MPATAEQTSDYRDGYRGYLLLMFLLVLSITVLVMFNASGNWAAIIACLVCLLMLAVRLAYAQRQWRQAQRARQLSPPSRLNSNDGFYAGPNNTLPNHLRQTDDEFIISEYILAMAEEERQRQPVYTISRRHDPPPDYDSVTKSQRPPRLSLTTVKGDIPSIHSTTSSQSQHSLQSNRSRQETARRSDSSNSSLTDNVPRGRPSLSLELGSISPNSAPAVAEEPGTGGHSPQPPSYDEALAARIYQQLGLENR